MDRGRMEAFSDGVFAIIITIMVLELKPPTEEQGTDLSALWESTGTIFIAYVLSFVYVGIYWLNHHHLLKQVRRVTASVMWANLALLFVLTLLPFVTGWAGEHHDEHAPVFVYGLVLFCAAAAYFVLQTVIVVQNGGWDGPLGTALGKDYKGRASLVLYVLALVVVWFSTWLAFALFVVVAIIWFIPDRRLERALAALEPAE